MVSGPALAIPAELEGAMRQFARDFDAMAAYWISAGHETSETMADAREGLRAYLADRSDPDDYGVSRVDRLRHVFDFWRGVALRNSVPSRGVAAVRPVLSFEAERRLEEVWAKRLLIRSQQRIPKSHERNPRGERHHDPVR